MAATTLAHELIHIRRGDHLVRLLELAATTIFWWHSVVWWASRQLHELEEQCCDGRVLELVPHLPQTYAAALVDTLEFLSKRPRTAVPLPTAIDSTGALCRRIFMLAQSRATRLSALSALLVAGLAILPLVVAFAADSGPTSPTVPGDQPSARPRAAVLRGRVTNEAGAPLADVRVRVAIPAADMRFVDVSTPQRRVETRTDAGGAYRVEIPGITGPTKVSLDAMRPGYRRLVGTLMSGGDPQDVEVTPGAEAEASLTLKPSLYFRGTVIDEQGKPISGVNVSANASYTRSSGGIERTATNPDGSFELFCYTEKLPDIGEGAGRGHVFFFHPDYIDTRIVDVYALAPKDRESVRVVFRTGYKVTGTVIDAAGKPVPRAMIKAVTRKDGGHGKSTLTDANGKFALRGLSEGLTLLSARNLEIKQKTQMPMALNGDKVDLEVRLKPIELPAGLKSYSVLGMQLADVTPELKSAYDLYNDRGALILDPGPNPDRLKIGELAEGDVFWVVGQRRVGSVREFVDQLLAEPGLQIAGERRIRVVYSFIRVNAEGTNTQYIRFTEDERKQLQMLSLRWHWVLGPPHTQASPWLMISFGLCAALLGLSSFLVALAALHWTRRASALVVGVAVLGFFFKSYFDWDQFLIWQLLVILGVQTGCLVVALIAARSLGYGLGFVDDGGRSEGKPTSNMTLRFSISDILIFTGAMSLFFVAMRGARPIDLTAIAYAINIAGGCGAALVGLTVLWACFGSSPVFLRGAALILVAPTGGIVYVLAARYSPLLFSWQWWAGVTSAQVLFMTIPCLMLRALGFRFLRGGVGR